MVLLLRQTLFLRTYPNLLLKALQLPESLVRSERQAYRVGERTKIQEFTGIHF